MSRKRNVWVPGMLRRVTNIHLRGMNGCDLTLAGSELVLAAEREKEPFR